MRKVDDFSLISGLVTKYMQPGVLTNNHMQISEYRALIADGLLYMHEWCGGLLFLCKKESRQLLRFHICDTDFLPDISLPSDTVAEIPYKPSGAVSAAIAASYLDRCGFSTLFERVRLRRPACCGITATGSGHSICNADAPMFDIVQTLLRDCFDPRTGCLPLDDELLCDIKNGNVLYASSDAETAIGLLRSTERASSFGICHLAVREDLRGRGIAGALLHAFVTRSGHKRITVWTREGYTPAQRLYASAGFAPDGLRSYVLAMDKKLGVR
ncbi:MAG: GNAT family N-acetyltransferase [Oscillospiraceae bacterium]|jgi:GNAT superfamily N-acetyltransferase|nr:GNAT family N-acetyltransferase [Oscillospiraceae bacterium]